MKPLIKINNTQITLRPSSIDEFFQCAFRWGKTFIEGEGDNRPNSRAAIGTSIHAAAETAWTESIKAGTKVANLSYMLDAAMEAWKIEESKDVVYGDGETQGTCAGEIMKGTETFVEDIMPYADIPIAVEKRFTVPINHIMVKELSGTVDYITHNSIADLKTGKRKPTLHNYTTQQSVYTYLAIANGVDVKRNLIHSVVLKKAPEGGILRLDPNIPQAKLMVNTVLDTLDLVAKDVAPIETILRGNPKYHFCSERWCQYYNSCPFAKGDIPGPIPKKVKL